jgi:iron complex transport system permease protein
MTVSVMLGPISLKPDTVWRIIISQLPFSSEWVTADWTMAEQNIVWHLRLPRVLMGAIVGAGLAVIGVAMQALVRNSMADPFVLGVSSGASVGATLVILLGFFSQFGQYALSLGAFSGALLAIVFVFIISQVGGRISSTRLLLAGIAISMMFSATTNMIVLSAPDEEGIRSALFWMMGGLSGTEWHYLIIPGISILVGTLLLLFQSRSLNAMLMGEETAATLGINTIRLSKFLIVFTALLTGVIVSVSGSIGFVGLMVPHIVRLLVGSDHRRVLPVSALTGAIFLIWADSELPVGVITSMCGAPFFIWLLRRSAYSFGGEGR